jgi:hypothetical protein
MSAISVETRPTTANALPVVRVGNRSWAALDLAVEATYEAHFNQKVSWRESLFSWLIQFNRY